ncbi:MAG TPA: PPOX class F420-dependent oxidoreductase [Aggregatilinea sp.]|jgi:PPOX class probable F420-dependent enzyme|uniref:PPOX class F420-dependent oxidoreductase n=1 Tax=Aggregatilinea sp. TaxID=2806333 RepID=UPI002D0EFA39|nr:PPOX class F420-dependent oxidoreductase [Aggregatilinea sp.]HML23153.1 PPOX class F420-dependent oxidoreductase [Aggregatilinea sp.]
MAAKVPESHVDLLERPVFVSLATVNPNGQPQVTPVWATWDGHNVIVNTARGRQKDRNMQANPHVTVLAIDPENPYRYLEIRGRVVEMDEKTGLDVINQLSAKYRGNPDYYAPYPERRGMEQRVTVKIEPEKVNANG